MEKKDQINFDLEFLEKNTKEKPKEQPKHEDPNWVYHKDDSEGKDTAKNPTSSSDGMSDNAKKWAWGIGIFLVFIIIGAFSGDSGNTSSSSSSTYTPTSSVGTVTKNGYTCSQYDNSQADSLDPDLNNMTIRTIDTDQAALDQRSVALDAEKARVTSEGETVTNTSEQYEIDAYNSDIDSYNAKLHQYQRDASALSDRIDAYNISEQPHNNYLAQHCTKD